jgi:hypothetical protein
VKDREYLRDLTPHSVDDSIITHDYFSKGRIADFRNDATRSRVAFKPIDGRDDQLDDKIRGRRRLASL